MPLLLLALFLLLPIAELYVIIQVGQAIGLVPTLAILILDGFVGAALARSQGRAAWERFNRALAEGRVPARETFDGAMIILGGALLLTPGFITDVVGFCLLLPPTRALIRAGVARLARRRVMWTVASPPRRPSG
ncbi:MAG TPA: FxsA family protein, partial [Solirubrobacterales bacterium]|nr:FxsA family protein [Solirubrobacterales bacterium]